MLFAIAAFAVVFAAFLGTYWALLLRPEGRSQRDLERRLRPVKATRTAEAASLLRRIVPLSTVPSIDKYLSRSKSVAQPLERLINRSGLTLTVGQLLLGMLFAGVTGAAAAFWLTREPLAAVACGFVFAALPWAAVRAAARRRLARFEEQFPEAIDLIARALRAGHAFTTGIGMVADEVPDPVRTEFRLLHDRQNFGMPLAEALRSFAERVPLLDARFFVTAVLTQRESGGNLSEVLDSLAALIRDRFRLKRQVRVLSAHGRITGWVLGCLPFAIGGILFVIAPDHISKLFTDPLGIRMVIVVAVLQVIGFAAMRRIVNIEI